MSAVQLEEEVREILDCSEADSLQDALNAVRLRLKYITGIKKYDPEKHFFANDAEKCFENCHIPILIIAKPGIGKTYGMKQLIEQFSNTYSGELGGEKVGFKQIVFAQTDVGDFSGVPMEVNGQVIRVQTDDLPNEERDGKYGVLFLDELTTADEQQVQPALSLADSRRTCGPYKLPDGWLVVAAGNGPDCENFVRLDLATVTRFEVFNIPNVDYERDWKDYAESCNMPAYILSFLDTYPELIYKVEEYEEGFSDMTPYAPSAVPRSWEAFASTVATACEEVGLEPTLERTNPKHLTPKFIKKIAMRFLGKDTAGLMEKFCVTVDACPISLEKILEGKEEPMAVWKERLDAKGQWKKEHIYYLLEEGKSKLKMGMNNAKIDVNTGVDQEFAKQLANYVNWFIAVDRDDTSEEKDTIMAMLSMLFFDKGLSKADDVSDMQKLCQFARSAEMMNRYDGIKEFISRNREVLTASAGFATY